jgi:hypothetical protein
MGQSELAKLYLDAWLNVGRGYWGGLGRQTPFPGNEEPAHTNPGPDTEDVHARRFLAMLQRLNAVSEAGAKINHAWVSLALSRLAGMKGGLDKGESDHESRKHAIEQLTSAYSVLIREYARGWSDVWAPFLPPDAWK